MKKSETIMYLNNILGYYLPGGKVYTAIKKAINAVEESEQTCDTCKYKSGRFNSRRCGDCSVGYPNRYEKEKV